MPARPEGEVRRAGLSPTRDGNARDNAAPAPLPCNVTAGPGAGADAGGTAMARERSISRPAIMVLRRAVFQDPPGNPARFVRWSSVPSYPR